jgi:pyrimidine operon attenuation protein / uracil phosphoribosyltransferase
MAVEQQVLLEKSELGRTIQRMAHEIIERVAAPSDLVMIGIRSRGVFLARRLARRIGELGNPPPPVGAIDITPFRDDRPQGEGAVSSTGVEISAPVDEKTVVLIDDVIYRGRTIRAAMEAVERLGQPRRIVVAVLIDRGARELPIRADIVGRNVDAGEGYRVNVRLQEADGVDQVVLSNWYE